MIDNQFDNFVNGKLKDHSAPVPAGLWDKVADGQFDNFISNKLTNHQAPVPSDLWDRITDTRFDSFVSNKLINHVAPLPPGLWEKIHPEEKDDRKGFILFRNPGTAVLAIALLLAGTLGGYLYFTSDKATDTGSNEVSLQKAADKTEGKEKAQESLQPNDQSATPLTTKDQPVDQPISNEAIPNTLKPNTPDGDVRLNRDATSIHTPADRQLSAQNNNKGGLNLAPINPKTNNSLPVYKDDITNGNNNNTPKNTNNSSNNKNTVSIHKSDPEENSFDFIEPYHSNLLTAVTIPSAANRYNGFPNLFDRQLTAGNHTRQFKNVIICPSDRKNRNTDWHLEVYTSPDIAFKSISNVSASQQYLLRKDSSESMQIGYTAGLRLVKPITDNIILKAGVQYSQTNEKFVYRTENEVKTTTVVTIRTIIRAPGDTVIVSDTSILTQIGFKNNTVKNRYRSFDIPVTIGYQFGNEDLKFGINAGVILNVSSWYQGVILDSSLATVPLTKSNNMVYKSNIGLGLYAGVSIIKRLSDDMHVFVEPYFRYNLSNMTTTQSSYNQKFSLGGVSLGLRFNLNRQ